MDEVQIKSIGTLKKSDAAKFLRKGSIAVVGTKSDFSYRLNEISDDNRWNLERNIYGIFLKDEIIAFVRIAQDMEWMHTIYHLETKLLLVVKKDLGENDILIPALKDIFVMFFQDFYATRITAEISDQNVSAKDILEKSGFQLEIIRKNRFYEHRSFKTLLIYGLVNNNFKIDPQYEKQINEHNQHTLQRLPGYEPSDDSRNS